MSAQRLKVFLAMSAAELSRPLWEWSPGDVPLVQRARRRVLGADPETYAHVLASADERVTDFAETE
ncbi:hypothetical protein SUDANB176_04048 [Streptomyces sp. enrichment culture]